MPRRIAVGGRQTGFAHATDKGFQYALVQDATGKTVGEIRQMNRWDRYATALIRGRFYKEQSKAAKDAQGVR